jgi:hypothetical protein
MTEIREDLKISVLQCENDHELPTVIPEVNSELPSTRPAKAIEIGAINLTSFTTAVHTQV